MDIVSVIVGALKGVSISKSDANTLKQALRILDIRSVQRNELFVEIHQHIKEEGSTKMAKPTKKFWKVTCMMCETTMEMEAIVIQNMEGTADFIIEPKYICGKCKLACVLELVEKEIEPPIGRTR